MPWKIIVIDKKTRISWSIEILQNHHTISFIRLCDGTWLVLSVLVDDCFYSYHICLLQKRILFSELWGNRGEFDWECFKFTLFQEEMYFIFPFLSMMFSDNCVNRWYFLFACIFVMLEISPSWLKPREICNCNCRDVFIYAWIFNASNIVTSIIKEQQELKLASLILF